MIVRLIASSALALVVLVSAVACAGGGARADLTVFAAASLGEAFRAVGDAFVERNPGVRVGFNFAGSQTLSTQLSHGAAADVFAAADWRQMAAVQKAGLLGSAPVYFANNRLAVAVPAGADGVRALADLARPGVRLAVADAAVPAGIYARNALDLLAGDEAYPADFVAVVLSNVATNETSVRGVVQKVALGEVDAGIIYETDAAAAQYADALRVIAIPLQFNPAAEYPIATLAAAPRPELARAFIELVQGDVGQAILREHGFAPPVNIACPCAGVGRRAAFPTGAAAMGAAAP